MLVVDRLLLGLLPTILPFLIRRGVEKRAHHLVNRGMAGVGQGGRLVQCAVVCRACICMRVSVLCEYVVCVSIAFCTLKIVPMIILLSEQAWGDSGGMHNTPVHE